MTKKCLACGYTINTKTCNDCGLQDLSEKSWIPENIKTEFVKDRKPIRQKPSVDEIKNIAKKAAAQCDYVIEGLEIVEIDKALFDTVINYNDPKNLTINCNLKKLRIYTEEELLSLLRQQILFGKTFENNAPFKSMLGAPQQQNEFRLGLKLAYDAFVAHKEYVKLFPNDKNYKSVKRFVLTDFLIESFDLKHQIMNPQSPFLLPAIVAIDMYQDTSYYFFEDEQKLSKWSKQNGLDALLNYWKLFHEDFIFIESYTSEKGETEKLLQLTEFLSSNIFVSKIFEENKISFIPTFQENMKTCDDNTTNPIGKAIIKSWRTRYDNSTN